MSARATSKWEEEGVPSVNLRKRESVQGMLGAGLPVDVSRTWQVTAGFGVDMWDATARSLSVELVCKGRLSVLVLLILGLAEMSGVLGVFGERDIVGGGVSFFI